MPTTEERGLGRILPEITRWNGPFWEGTREHRIRLPRCQQCSAWVHPIAPVCQNCGTIGGFVWQDTSGTGRASSWVTYHRAFPPFQDADVPYSVVEVQLDEGMRLRAPLVNGNAGNLSMGTPMRAAFRELSETITLPVFEPVPGAGDAT